MNDIKVAPMGCMYTEDPTDYHGDRSLDSAPGAYCRPGTCTFTCYDVVNIDNKCLSCYVDLVRSPVDAHKHQSQVQLITMR
eukprot:scaffold210576_cov49-Prasinocladus_malaysianus.AAC.1